MIEFEQYYLKELENEHRSIFLWKIELASFFLRNNHVQRGKEIAFQLCEQLDEK